MRFGSVLILVGAATGAAASPVRTVPSAIVNGTPWQAELYTGHIYTPAESNGRPQWDLAHRCGGSYIKEHWVLTAAHCFYQHDANHPELWEEQIDWRKNGWRVRLGARDLPSGEGISFPVDQVLIYPGFVHRTYTNDVALVHFVADAESQAEGARPNPGKYVAKIRLNGSAEEDAPVALGEAVTVSGWGKTEDRQDAPTSPELEWVTIHAVDCKWGGVYKGQTTADNLCAFGKGMDACQGDSGGPLIRAGGEPVLVGIVSWGISCGVNAGVYVRIDRQHYLDWINRSVGGLPSTSR